MARGSCRLTEEDTSKGGESAEKVSLPGDRRLSLTEVGGGKDRARAGSLLDVVVVRVVHFVCRTGYAQGAKW